MPSTRGRVRPGSPYLAGSPLLIAHRGGAAVAPENTLLAFRQAIQWWGADILEIDVQPTLDGEVVVLHDERVDRTTDGVGAAAQLTLDELRALDAAYRYTPDAGATHPLRGRGISIPTLSEVLTEFPEQRINVEVKDGRAGARVREVVLQARAEHRVLIAAGRKADRMTVTGHDCPTSAAEEEIRAFYLRHRLHLARFYRPAFDAFQLPHRHDGREIPTPRFVHDAHRLNLAVHVWTVDEPRDMKRLLAAGVDGIITDRPDRLARVLHEERGRPLPPGPPTAEKPGYMERLLLD
jgi:glycerophosphoryl diester phosphodiesterase